MPVSRLPMSCVSFALLMVSCAPALACPSDAVERLLGRAEEARFWSDFWEDIDRRESRAELVRAAWLFRRAERLLVGDYCLDLPAGPGLALQVAGGQFWTRRAAGRLLPPPPPAIAAVTP